MASDAAAYPMVVPPSGLWSVRTVWFGSSYVLSLSVQSYTNRFDLRDGNDGSWSTFEIQVGTPPQSVRVLVLTVLPQTVIVSANKTEGGCLITDSSACPESRGGLFNLNASSTWNDQGIYDIGIEMNLQDYQDSYFSADFGFDALGLGTTGSSGVRLDP